jgi:cytosine/adenosine deaminase-related metal-dependent hydrolase
MAKGDMLGFQIAFDVVAGPEFPERAAFDVARDLGVPVNTHEGVLGANGDDSIRLIHENGFMTPDTMLVHCSTLVGRLLPAHRRQRRSVSVATESEQSAGQGYPSSWKLRQFDIPISLSHDTSVWWSADLFTAMRTTLVRIVRASTSRPTRRARRSPSSTSGPSTSSTGRPGAAAKALGLDRQDRQHRSRQAGRRRAA